VRNPTLQDQYLYYNVGRAILVGNINGFDSLVTIQSIKDYYSATLINKDKLVYFNVNPVQPEKVKSVELGYRTLIFKRLYVDGSFYYSIYKHFLGYQLGGDINFAPAPNQNNISSITFYRVAANATSIVTTQGASVGLTYYFKKFFSLTGNYSWNQLNKRGIEDPIIPAYNTPAHKFNIGFSGREITTYFSLFSQLFKKTEPIAIHNFGFSINYKWVQGYLYEGSPQFTGEVPTYDMLDAQISKYIPKIKTIFKLGASNILNNKKFQVYGGPEIGRMAYFSALLELNK
jgi:outer membrane receptor protein involved in Fe transport